MIAEATPEQIRRAREAQALTNAYHRVFSTPDGLAVLADLRNVFGMDRPAFIRGPAGAYDPYFAAIRDGQRSVELHITAKLAAPTIGDANVEKPAVEVKT